MAMEALKNDETWVDQGDLGGQTPNVCSFEDRHLLIGGEADSADCSGQAKTFRAYSCVHLYDCSIIRCSSLLLLASKAGPTSKNLKEGNRHRHFKMGLTLPKPVTFVVSKRVDDIEARVGWGKSIEDDVVIYPQDTWNFFGVFGGRCSRFIANRIPKELEQSGMPKDNADVTELAQRLEEDFWAANQSQPSDCTGTFVIVKAPSTPGGKYHLRVGNIGRSRFLLGRADGSIPGPEPHIHQVCAGLEMKEFECGPTDFLMLVGDGIAEGTFSNEAVVKLAAEKLKSGDHPEQAAKAVCQQAMQGGFPKHLNCMIVLLGGGEVPGEKGEFIPGPFEAPDGEGHLLTIYEDDEVPNTPDAISASNSAVLGSSPEMPVPTELPSPSSPARKMVQTMEAPTRVAEESAPQDVKSGGGMDFGSSGVFDSGPPASPTELPVPTDLPGDEDPDPTLAAPAPRAAPAPQVPQVPRNPRLACLAFCQ
eukprot:symbB.v1.2.031084.t1/scaffold3512.1/size84356/5